MSNALIRWIILLCIAVVALLPAIVQLAAVPAESVQDTRLATSLIMIIGFACFWGALIRQVARDYFASGYRCWYTHPAAYPYIMGMLCALAVSFLIIYKTLPGQANIFGLIPPAMRWCLLLGTALLASILIDIPGDSGYSDSSSSDTIVSRRSKPNFRPYKPWSKE